MNYDDRILKEIELSNNLLNTSINPIATTGIIKAKEYIENLLDNAVKFILSDDDDKDRTYTESELNTIKNVAINGIEPIKNRYAKFPSLSPKSKFKNGDRVKIIKDHIMDIKRETVNFKGFEGVVYSSLNLISGMYNQNVLNCSYDVDINGFIVVCQESDLELIEQLKKMEYRADLYDLSDDIDGVLLPDSKPNIDFIQRFDKQ